MSKRVNRDDIDKFHDYGLYIPTRTIYLGSESYDGEGGESGVDGLMTERFVKNLTILDQASEEPIIILMNNPGGNWYDGMGIYDAIEKSRSHITIKVKGVAMSMGAILFQAADERIISRRSKFMIHYGEMGMGYIHSKIFNKWAKENDRVNKEMEDIFFARIKEKHPDFKLRKLQDMLDFDTILTAKETVELGLADKIEGEEDA